jgi:hypothetical protein
VQALSQPAWGAFEIEDILYVIAPLTWTGLIGPFVLAAGVGAPLFALWTAYQYRRTPPARATVGRPRDVDRPRPAASA